MEKKLNSRTNQVPAKVLSSEPRKSNQADATGKQPTRNSRRREFSSNFSQAQKLDRSTHNGNNYNQHKQQQQQQLQIFTPKSRGAADAKRGNGSASGNGRNANNPDGYTGGTTSSSGARLNHYDDDNSETINNDFEFELNSVYLPGSKKQNLNHLLNFNYAPRDQTDSTTYMRSGNIAKGHAYVKRIKYNKEQFLQANCQFVVKSTGDYKPYTISPDLLVEWSSIEQINFFGSSEEPQCPICLYHPVAAKMTRCGHVYCWPCILHYLALSDKKSWRKCPICYEAVHIGDLKSAVSKPHRNYNCGESVTFQLMRRDKKSLQVHTVNDAVTVSPQTMNKLKANAIANANAFPCLSNDTEQLKHSKLLLAQPLDVLSSIIGRERSELKCQLVSDGIDCPDSIFVQQALDLLEERERIVRAQIVDNDNPVEACNFGSVEEQVDELNGAIEQIVSLNADAKEFVPPVDQNDQTDQQQHGSDQMSSPDSESGDFIIDADSDLMLKDIDIVPVNATGGNCFYFYQSSDGQHLYLHSINVRMLQTMYGSLEHAPKSISGLILQKESCSMTEELRKRLKYLQHLPVTCQFDVVEIDVESLASIISDEVRAKFKDELVTRQKNRQRRAREERKREKHIDRENERRIGKVIHTAINIDVTSVQQFPTCGSFDDTAFPMPSPSQPTTNDIAGPSIGQNSSNNNPGPSFAKMLTSPMAAANKTEIWPTLGRPKDVPMFAPNGDSFTLKSANGTANEREIGMPSSFGNVEHSDEDSVDFAIDDLESAYSRPELKESFGSAIAEALNKAAALSKNPRKQQQTESSTGSRPINGGKKKKTTKKTILFSTVSRTFDGN